MNLRIVLRLGAVILTVLLLLFFPWDIISISWLNRLCYYSVLFILFITSSELIKHIFFHYYRKSMSLKPLRTDNITQAVDNLHYILIFFVVIGTILRFFDIHIMNVITSLSIVAAGIAIISKDYLSNIISGLITVFTKELEIDDNISIHNYKGKVKALTLSKVVMLNDDDDVVYIPNNTVFSTEFINYSKRKEKKSSIDFDLKTEKLKPFTTIEAILKQGIKEYLPLIHSDSIHLRVESIKHDYISFKFQYSLKNPKNNLAREIRRKVKREIVDLIYNS